MSYSTGDKSFVIKYISDIFYCVFVNFVTIHIDLCDEILHQRLTKRDKHRTFTQSLRQCVLHNRIISFLIIGTNQFYLITKSIVKDDHLNYYPRDLSFTLSN